MGLLEKMGNFIAPPEEDEELEAAGDEFAEATDVQEETQPEALSDEEEEPAQD